MEWDIYLIVSPLKVSIELHDPFGKDPNDFEIGRYTKVTALGIEEDLSLDGNRRFQRAHRPSSPTVPEFYCSPRTTYHAMAESDMLLP